MIRLRLILLSLLSNALGLMLPLALIQVYDRILANQAIGTAMVLFSAVLIAIILDGVTRFARSALYARLGAVAEYDLSLQVARRVLSMNRAERKRFGAGRIEELFASISTSRDALIGQSLIALFDAPFAIVFLVLVWFLGGPVVLAPVAIVVVVGILAFVSAARHRSANGVLFDARSAQKTLMMSGLRRMSFLRTRGLVGDFMFGLQRTEVSAAAASERAETATGTLMDLTQIASVAASVAILGTGTFMALKGEMTSGAIAACLILGQRAASGLVGLLSALARRQSAAAAHRELKRHLENRYDTDPAAATPKGPLGVQWLQSSGDTWTFAPGSVTLVEFTSVEDADDAFETFSDTLSGNTSEGQSAAPLRFVDSNLQQVGDATGSIALCGAAPTLFRGTILDNLSRFEADNIDEATKMARSIGLDEAVGRLSDGYQKSVGEGLSEPLSSGMIKRIGLVRAFAPKPGLVVLNHPTFALDKAGLDRLTALLSEGSGETTVILLCVEGAYLDLPEGVARERFIVEAEKRELAA